LRTSSPLPEGQFYYVPESSDAFLALFPHRYDYIWAERPSPGQKPQWQTETRYPLGDEGTHLYGVRFGPQTQYLLIDIDTGSPYHPRSDRLAIPQLVAALEPLGLVSYVACSSSYSGGLHLYFPFEEPQKTWDLAFAVQSLLERAGFGVRQGHLEIFPNPKLYVREGNPGLYAAHRLPLQEPGSYILDRDWTPYSASRHQFVQSWQWAVGRNLVLATAITKIVETTRQFQQGLSRAASKFLQDLNTEIEQGWTNFGQTNRLLGRIAMRSYIFGHILHSSEPLEGKELIRDIVHTAQHLPGYFDWCRHQHEIEKRAEDWARCIENSHYFPYRLGEKKANRRLKAEAEVETQSWNQRQANDARSRIQQAIAHLLNQNCFPSTTTLRFKSLVQMGIGGSTLYRHRDLWHPDHIHPDPVQPGHLQERSPDIAANYFVSPIYNEGGAQSKEDYAPLPKSLLQPSGRNSSPDQDLLAFAEVDLMAGRNSGLPGSQQETANDRQQQQMQAYLASNDPILMAEAQRWLEQQERASSSPPSLEPQPAPVITSRESFQVLIEAIAYHISRLGWSAQDISQHLMQRVGKPVQALLTDYELSAWLAYLEGL